MGTSSRIPATMLGAALASVVLGPLASVSTQSDSGGEVEHLGPSGPMCDLLPLDDLNEIFGISGM